MTKPAKATWKDRCVEMYVTWFGLGYAPVASGTVGYLVAVAWIGFPGWNHLILGFFLFRLFDIVKPPPARRLEKLPGGWGIVVDDLVAGAYALVVMVALRSLFPDLLGT